MHVTLFGFSFSELVVVVLVALIVMGPKDLPKMLRRLGQWAGKLRRAAADLRAQSGIDDALRSEGLADDIAEIRKLARGELEAVRTAASASTDGPTARAPEPSPYGARGDDFYVVRDREYPRDGADAYGALPDNAIVYADGLPKSPLYRDALYRMGDESADLPPEPEVEPDALAGQPEDDAPPDETSRPGEVTTTLIGVGNAPKVDQVAAPSSQPESGALGSAPSKDANHNETEAP